MKVLLASESFAPNISGVATATKNLAVNLTKNGHEAFVLTPGKTLKNKVDPNFSDYTVYRLKSIVNPFRRGYRITFTTDSEIERLVYKIHPDVIHLQDPAAIGQSLRRVGKKLGIPVVATNHFPLEYALSYVRFFSILRPFLKRNLTAYLVAFYNKCDAIITPTETLRSQLLSWGVKTKVTAISNGVDYNRFSKSYSADQIASFRKKYSLPDKLTVLYRGRIDKDKSINVLVKSIPLVLAKLDVHFIILGGGGEVANMKLLAKELKIESNVTFLGFLEYNSDDFVLVDQASSLFAIPSKSEAQSIVTLEAMSAGLPIVAAKAGALPELAQNNVNGFVFRPDNETELAEKIIYILEDKNRTKKMGDESQKIAKTHEMSTAFAKMLDFYKKMIEK